LSGQNESLHFFRTGDSVRSIDGRLGTITEGLALYAIVRWEDQIEESGADEIDQFDPGVVVMRRSES